MSSTSTSTVQLVLVPVLVPQGLTVQLSRNTVQVQYKYGRQHYGTVLVLVLYIDRHGKLVYATSIIPGTVPGNACPACALSIHNTPISYCSAAALLCGQPTAFLLYILPRTVYFITVRPLVQYGPYYSYCTSTENPIVHFPD